MPTGRLHRIVLTGGPCAGKTTGLSHAREHLETLGIRTFIVPEVATMVIKGGVDFSVDPEDYFDLQKEMIQLQLQLEHTFLMRAKHAQEAGFNCALIVDRGLMDFAAYIEPEKWKALLDAMGHSVIGFRDRRYDGVVHMMTAANGAEDFYTTANNSARLETPEQARALDKRLLEAWIGHPHLTIINNAGTFQSKIKRMVGALARIVGIPEPLEIERRFLIKDYDGETRNTDVSRWDMTFIHQAYLGKGHRIRKRGHDDHYAYTQTVKRELRPGVRFEDEWPISAKEYFKLYRQVPLIPRFSDFGIKPTIEKARQVFVWENQVFELDTFNNPCSGMMILECETADEDTPVTIPQWINVEKEVTYDPRYSNYAIAMNRIV